MPHAILFSRLARDVKRIDVVGARHGPNPGRLCYADSLLWGLVPVWVSGVGWPGLDQREAPVVRIWATFA